MEIKDIVELKEPLLRVIDCLEKGISSLLSPFMYKRLERAKLQIEQERAQQNEVIALREAMMHDIIEAARTTRDRQEIANIAAIYGGALLELQSMENLQLPAERVSTEWASHFYDNAKYCSDEEVQALWAKILAGEIQTPGKYYKRTLANLKQMERHEAEWFCKMCRLTIDGSYLPVSAIEDQFLPFNEYQSLVDCGFLNADQGEMEISKDTVMQLKTGKIEVKVTDTPYHMNVATLTDTGLQICEIVQTESNRDFFNKLVNEMNESKQVVSRLIISIAS